MRPKQAPTLVAVSTKRPRLNPKGHRDYTQDEVQKEFEALVLEHTPHSLEVAQDLLLETGYKLADVSERTFASHPDYPRTITSRSRPTYSGMFVLNDDQDSSNGASVLWEVADAVDYFREPDGDNRGHQVHLRCNYGSGTWVDSPPPFRLSTGRDVRGYAVEMAWRLVKLIVQLWGSPLSELRSAFMNVLPPRVTFTPREIINPASGKPMRHNAGFGSSFRTPAEAEQEFLKLLHDPDPLSMEIALDALEEGNLEIAEVSQRAADPQWLAGRARDDRPILGGVFEIGSVHPRDEGWWTKPAKRGLRLRDPEYIIVEWIVTQDENKSWRHEIYFWRRGKAISQNLPQGWGELADSIPFPTKEEAIEDAVMTAWRVVQAIKERPGDANKVIAKSVFHTPSRFENMENAWDPLEGRSDHGPHENPPRTSDEIMHEWRRLLLEPEPSALDIAQDLLLENGWTLYQASTRAADPEWIAAEIAQHYEPSPFLDGGVFVLSARSDVVAPGWFTLRDRPGQAQGRGLPDRLLDDPTFSMVQWEVQGRHGAAGWVIRYWRPGQGWISLSSVAHAFTTVLEATRVAVLCSWRVVRGLKTEPHADRQRIKILALVDKNDPPPELLPHAEQGGMESFGSKIARTRMQNPSPETNPSPAAWVVKGLADHWVTLEGQVPPAWMPKLDLTRAKGKRLTADIPEYGHGAYGAVLPTNDPKIVLKITTDDTEAEFAARLAKTLPVPVVTKYELVLELPTAKHQGRRVYLLWREAADHVGEVDKVVGDEAEVAIGNQHSAAQAAYLLLHEGKPAVRELAEWVKQVKAMGKVSALKWLADGLLRAYDEKGIGFFDIHAGNLGLAHGQWVIVDPGHVAVLKR